MQRTIIKWIIKSNFQSIAYVIQSSKMSLKSKTLFFFVFSAFSLLRWKPIGDCPVGSWEIAFWVIAKTIKKQRNYRIFFFFAKSLNLWVWVLTHIGWLHHKYTNHQTKEHAFKTKSRITRFPTFIQTLLLSSKSASNFIKKTPYKQTNKRL